MAKYQEVRFTIRKMFSAAIDSDVFFTPFEIINLILSITVQPFKIGDAAIKINLMDLKFYKSPFNKISYTEDCDYGNYGLA